MNRLSLLERVLKSDRVRRHARFVFLSNLPLDLVVEHVGEGIGSKRPARILDRLGGPAGNGAPVVVRNAIPCAVVGTQPDGLGAQFCRLKAREMGIGIHLVPTTAIRPAITVAMPNGSPGQHQLFVQRAGNPFHSVLDRHTRRLVEHAKVVFIGPVPVEDDQTLQGLHAVLEAAARAFVVLVPHPTLLIHRAFPTLAQKASYVQINSAEAALLDPSTTDMNKHALRALFLLSKVEFAITNGGQRGLLWTGARWQTINPPRVEKLERDIGLGDGFASAYAAARGSFEAEPEIALDYAIRVAAQMASGRPITPFFATLNRLTGTVLR